MNKFVDTKLLKFLIVGVTNTLFSIIIMFMLYNLLHFGYWGSSAISYILGSILSFILNKNFTFKNKDSLLKTGIKFVIIVVICYLIAYSVAKPIIFIVLQNIIISVSIIEQISMLFGMVLYTLLNYFGQRFFAFK